LAISVSGSHTYTTAGGYSVQVTITDVGGNQLMASIPASVTNPNSSSPLVVSNPGSQTSAAGMPVSLQIQASGGSGSYTYGAGGLPSGLTINSATGLISGTINPPATGQPGGSSSASITVTDSTGATGGTTFDWATTPSTSLTLANPGDQMNWDSDSVSLQLAGSEAGNPPLTYSAGGLPSGLTIDSTTGLISGTLGSTDDAGSPYAVTVGVSDGTNSASQSFNWTVANVVISPVGDQTNLRGDGVSLGVAATDAFGQPLTYAVGGLPPGLSINPTTGLISGTIANNASITTPYTVTASASDGSHSASTSFTWTVGGFVLGNPGDQTNTEGDAVSLQPTVETNGDPSISFSLNRAPSA
jgi:hypothetical protein